MAWTPALGSLASPARQAPDGLGWEAGRVPGPQVLGLAHSLQY